MDKRLNRSVWKMCRAAKEEYLEQQCVEIEDPEKRDLHRYMKKLKQ